MLLQPTFDNSIRPFERRRTRHIVTGCPVSADQRGSWDAIANLYPKIDAGVVAELNRVVHGPGGVGRHRSKQRAPNTSCPALVAVNDLIWYPRQASGAAREGAAYELVCKSRA